MASAPAAPAGAIIGLDVAASAVVLGALATSADRVSAALLLGGSYPASLEIAESALERAAELGGKHEQILALRSPGARPRAGSSGRQPRREAEFRQVLAARMRILGPYHPDTLATLYQIASALAVGQAR